MISPMHDDLRADHQARLTRSIDEIFGDDLDDQHRRDLVGIVLIAAQIKASASRMVILDVAAIGMQAELASDMRADVQD